MTFKIVKQYAFRKRQFGLVCTKMLPYFKCQHVANCIAICISVPSARKILKSIAWTLAEFRHNMIVQSSHESCFNVFLQLKEKGFREDADYSNAKTKYGVSKDYHISGLLKIIKRFIRPPQGIVIFIRKNSLRISTIITIY